MDLSMYLEITKSTHTTPHHTQFYVFEITKRDPNCSITVGFDVFDIDITQNPNIKWLKSRIFKRAMSQSLFVGDNYKGFPISEMGIVGFPEKNGILKSHFRFLSLSLLICQLNGLGSGFGSRWFHGLIYPVGGSHLWIFEWNQTIHGLYSFYKLISMLHGLSFEKLLYNFKQKHHINRI